MAVEGDGLEGMGGGEGGDDGVEGGVGGGGVEGVEEAEGEGEVVIVGVEGDDGVPDDDVSVWVGYLEEEVMGEWEGEAGAVEVEKGGGDEGVGEERGLGGVGMEGGGEEGKVEGGAGLEGEGEEMGVHGEEEGGVEVLEEGDGRVVPRVGHVR